jgi:hypothetical protein
MLSGNRWLRKVLSPIYHQEENPSLSKKNTTDPNPAIIKKIRIINLNTLSKKVEVAGTGVFLLTFARCSA